MRTVLLMIGSAVCGVVIFVAGVYGYFWYQASRLEAGLPVRFPPRSEKTIAAVPPVSETERFHGTFASLSGDFPMSARDTVLAAGPGRLVGGVTSGGKPLAGVRLRLALNGAAMSQWATTGADGKYEVAVPYAKYRIDGYELDSSLVHAVLGGKTDGPRDHRHPNPTVIVAEGAPGQGLDFAFVDPVRKKTTSGTVSLAQPVVVSWEPYPAAASYRLQLVEQKDPGDYADQKYLFDWRDRPVVSVTSANLAELGVTLKKGYYYTLQIEARDDRGRQMSTSPRNHGYADFRVVD